MHVLTTFPATFLSGGEPVRRNAQNAARLVCSSSAVPVEPGRARSAVLAVLEAYLRWDSVQNLTGIVAVLAVSWFALDVMADVGRVPPVALGGRL